MQSISSSCRYNEDAADMQSDILDFRCRTVVEEWFNFSHNPLNIKLELLCSHQHPLKRIKIALDGNWRSQTCRQMRGWRRIYWRGEESFTGTSAAMINACRGKYFKQFSHGLCFMAVWHGVGLTSKQQREQAGTLKMLTMTEVWKQRPFQCAPTLEGDRGENSAIWENEVLLVMFNF